MKEIKGVRIFKLDQSIKIDGDPEIRQIQVRRVQMKLQRHACEGTRLEVIGFEGEKVVATQVVAIN